MQETKNKVTERAVESITNTCKLCGLDYMSLDKSVQKMLLQIYIAGYTDCIEELRHE